MSNPYAPPSSTLGKLSLDKGGGFGGDPFHEQRWNLSGVMNRAWAVFQERPGIYVGAVGVKLGIQLGIGLLFGLMSAGVAAGIAQAGGDPVVGQLASQAISIASDLFRVFLGVGMLRLFLGSVRGESPLLGMLFSGMPWFGNIFLGNLLMGLAVLVSLCALGIPLFILVPGLALWQYLVIDQGQGAIEALKGSWALTMGSKVDIAVLLLVIGLINTVGVLACGVGLLVSLPVTGLATALVFENMRIHGPKSAS
jgi:hypothetical protein